MENKYFSLFRPEGTPDSDDTCFNARGLMEQLGAYTVLYGKNVRFDNMASCDIGTIKQRQDCFRDLMKTPELVGILKSCAEQLETIKELFNAREHNSSNETNLHSIREVETFIEFTDYLHDSLAPLTGNITSLALRNLYNVINDTYCSDEYTILKDNIAGLSISIKNVKSLTIGINLDSKLDAYEAGLLSVNDEYYRGGDVFSRFLRSDYKPDKMITSAPLAVVDKNLPSREKSVLNVVLISALQKVLGNTLSGWQKMMNSYFKLNTGRYLRILPELYYLIGGIDTIERLKSAGLPLCFPKAHPISEKRFDAKALYDPGVAVNAVANHSRVVFNDVTFDENGMLYILTGPNHGGKSILLCAVGIAQLMFQLGLPVAAASMEISPVDNIYTHFYSEAQSALGKGRFEEECERLQKMLKNVTENSMILLDESLSGTDSYEATVIAKEVMTGLGMIGCRGMFATHLHQLAQAVPEINSHDGIKSKADNLVMGIFDGKPNFKAYRKQPDGRSYAYQIAEKYGLSSESIFSKRNEVK